MTFEDLCLKILAERYNNDMEREMIAVTKEVRKKIDELNEVLGILGTHDTSAGTRVVEDELGLTSRSMIKRLVGIFNTHPALRSKSKITKKQQAEYISELVGFIVVILGLWDEDRATAFTYHNKAKKKIEELEKDIAALVEHNDKIRDRRAAREGALSDLVMRIIKGH
jgi:hypothetical protein